MTYFELFTKKFAEDNMCFDGTANIPSALQIGLCDILKFAIAQSLTIQLLSVELPENMIIVEHKCVNLRGKVKK
jgi:nucleosome binding factor SPN SPT16 subunit